MGKRRVAMILGTLVGLYAIGISLLYLAMLQPPDTFGAIMANVPGVSMMILPFRPLWMSARSGHLSVGDAAPDFELPVLGENRQIKLANEYREKPVVLVFGSYT